MRVCALCLGGLVGCGEVELDAWTLPSSWRPELDEADWLAAGEGEERASGWWAPPDLDPEEEAFEESFGPYAHAPYESCDPETEQCSWETAGVSVDWREAPDPWDMTLWNSDAVIPIYQPEVRLGDGPVRVPGDWGDTVRWTADARRFEGVPREGCATLQGTGHTGGAQCCALHLLVTVCPEAHTVTVVDARYGRWERNGRVVDVDHDGVYEFVVTDWSWSGGAFMDGDGPPIWRVLAWGHEGWAEPQGVRFGEFYEEQARIATRATEERMAEADSRSWDAQPGATQAGSYAMLAGASDEVIRATVDGLFPSPEMDGFLEEATRFTGRFAHARTIEVARPIDP